MKTLHVLILAGAILGAAWILKPAPVEQVSQAELQRREELERFFQGPDKYPSEETKKCAASIGKTPETLDLNDPKQKESFRKCLWPEEPRGPIQRMWHKLCGVTR